MKMKTGVSPTMNREKLSLARELIFYGCQGEKDKGNDNQDKFNRSGRRKEEIQVTSSVVFLVLSLVVEPVPDLFLFSNNI